MFQFLINNVNFVFDIIGRMNKPYEEIFDNLKEKITDLILMYEQVNDENIRLKKEIETISIDLNERDTKIREFEERYNALAVAKTLVTEDDGDKALAKERINRIVREIDQCIALLNR